MDEGFICSPINRNGHFNRDSGIWHPVGCHAGSGMIRTLSAGLRGIRPAPWSVPDS